MACRASSSQDPVKSIESGQTLKKFGSGGMLSDGFPIAGCGAVTWGCGGRVVGVGGGVVGAGTTGRTTVVGGEVGGGE
jgi:hypothetical protein